jgi:hypothetical protein
VKVGKGTSARVLRDLQVHGAALKTKGLVREYGVRWNIC